MMKKLLCVIFALLLLTGCRAPQAETTNTTDAPATEAETLSPIYIPTQQATTEPQVFYTVGISLPEQSQWQATAEKLTALLSQQDCQVALRYADQDPATQLSQIEELIALETDCLIVAAIDSVLLAPTLSSARSAGIPVIAWDRLLMDTEDVSCCVTFDYAAIGAAMGQGIVRELALDSAAQENRSYTVEFFMGSSDNHSAMLLHKGLMEVLEPHLNSGTLVCRSGRVSFEDSCIQHSDPNATKLQCNALIQRHYTKELRPDVMVTASDVMANSCIQVLTELGCPQENWPLITGQGTGTAGLRRVTAGKQTLTLWCDETPLIQKLADAVFTFKENDAVPIEHTVNNHVTDVPVFYIPAVEIHRDNLESVLVEQGIYTLEELTE